MLHTAGNAFCSSSLSHKGMHAQFGLDCDLPNAVLTESWTLQFRSMNVMNITNLIFDRCHTLLLGVATVFYCRLRTS